MAALETFHGPLFFKVFCSYIVLTPDVEIGDNAAVGFPKWKSWFTAKERQRT
jgi:hypothetical protein